MDLYECLGIPPNASADEIKRAYRTLAMKYHPDAGGDADIFNTVLHAYKILSNPVKRRQYDRGDRSFHRDDVNIRSMQQLCLIFSSVLDKHMSDLNDIDIIGEVRNIIKMNSDNANSSLDDAHNKKKTLEGFGLRLKKHSPNDFLSAHLESLIIDCDKAIESATDDAKLCELMTKHIDDYELV